MGSKKEDVPSGRRGEHEQERPEPEPEGGPAIREAEGTLAGFAGSRGEAAAAAAEAAAAGRRARGRGAEVKSGKRASVGEGAGGGALGGRAAKRNRQSLEWQQLGARPFPAAEEFQTPEAPLRGPAYQRADFAKAIRDGDGLDTSPAFAGGGSGGGGAGAGRSPPTFYLQAPGWTPSYTPRARARLSPPGARPLDWQRGSGPSPPSYLGGGGGVLDLRGLRELRAAAPADPGALPDAHGLYGAAAAADGAAADLAALRRAAEAAQARAFQVDYGERSVRLMARVDAALGQSSLAETRAKARAIEMEELRQVQEQLEQARLEPSSEGDYSDEYSDEEGEEGDGEGEDSGEEDSEEESGAPELSEEDEEIYAEAMGPGPDQVAEHAASFLVITRKDIECFAPGTWLNDECVNFYMSLLNDRDKADADGDQQFPRCHFFNTFFHEKLTPGGGYEYKAISRWTRPKKLKKDIHEHCDRIVFPIHLPAHWTCLCVNVAEKRIEYYDSMAGAATHVTNAFKKWYCDDVRDKKGQEVDFSEWSVVFPDCPQQRNGFDCGVFAIKFAECLGRGGAMDFSQRDMPYFRKKLVCEIVQVEAAWDLYA